MSYADWEAAREAEHEAAIRAKAAAEGLQLETADETYSGFAGVRPHHSLHNPFAAVFEEATPHLELGRYPTAIEAALALARYKKRNA